MEYQSGGAPLHPVDDLLTPVEGDIMNNLTRQPPPPSEENSHYLSLHPSEHRTCYFAAGPRWTSPATQGVDWDAPPHGRWREKQRAVVRDVATSAGSFTSSASSTRYVGVKREMHFNERNDTKTGWTMMQYQLLRREEGRLNDFVIEDKMIFCVVFNRKRQARGTDAGELHGHVRQTLQENLAERVESSFKDIHNPFTNAPLIPSGSHSPTIPGPPLQGSTGEIFEDLHKYCFDPNELMSLYDDVPVSEPIRSTGGVWDNFIKIHSKDHQDVYAACICCGRMLRADSKKHGTNQLKRHYEACCT